MTSDAVSHYRPQALTCCICSTARLDLAECGHTAICNTASCVCCGELALTGEVRWALAEERDGPLTNERERDFLRVYALWGVIAIFLYCVRSVSFSEHRLRVAKKLHEQMHTKFAKLPA